MSTAAYLPQRQAAVHIEDRGYQFADGVYEVIAVVAGHLVDEEPHLEAAGPLAGRIAHSDADDATPR